MNREIKFRGQRVDNKKWVYGFYFKTPLTDEATNSKPEDGWSFLSGRERYCISQGSCVYEVIPETVGQYTGLKDKNGKEIYEGDILKLSFFMTNEKGIVKFGQNRPSDMSIEYECGNQGFYVDVTNDKYSSWRKDIWFYCSNCEVIGNIYENPELLK